MPGRFKNTEALLSGGKVATGKFGATQALLQEEPEAEEPSFWQKINTPLVSLISPQMRQRMEEAKKGNDLLSKVTPGAEFVLDAVSSQSSPLSVGLGGLTAGSAVAKGLATSKLIPPAYAAKAAQVANAANSVQKAASLGMVGHGAYGMATAETLPEFAGSFVEGIGGIAGYRGARGERINVKPPVPTPVMPEVITDPRRMLTAKSAVQPPSFIAGPAGVAKNAPYKGGVPGPNGELVVDLPPDLVAREGGTIGQGIDRPNVEVPLNLDAAAEAKRLAAIRGSQGWNGMVKLGNDPVPPDIPVQSGDVRRGFSQQSNADLPYPLNVTPNAVRPRTVQSVTEALVPERMKVDLPQPKEPVTFQSAEVSLPGESVKSNQWQKPELPSAPPKPLRPKTGNAVVDKAVESPVPEIQKAAQQIAKEESGKKISSFQQLTSTLGTQLKSMGKAGEELYRRSARYTQVERQRLSEWAEPYKNAITKLTKEERANFGDFVEGNAPIPNERVQAAVNAWNDVASKSGAMGVQSGLRIKTATGEKVPFQPIEQKYWPRHITEEYLKSQGLDDVIGKMMQEQPNLTRQQAEQMLKSAREHGELIVGPQHERLNRLFPYRKDAESGLIHLEKMARRTAQSTEFGPLDMAGKGNEGIGDLIEQTSDPKRAHEIMQRIIGRDEKVVKNLDEAVRKARTAVSWMRLQNYALSATGGNQIPIIMKAGFGEWANSLKAVTTNWKASKAITDEAGALASISHGMLEELSKINPMKLYGGEAVENLVRTQSAIVGRSMAKNFFTELKKNPNNQAAMKELFELVLEDPKKILAQKELTPEQLKMAAGRGAEIIQGLTAPVNLPGWASTPVNSGWNAMGQMMMVFKKQAMLYNKLLYDSMKANPVRTTAILAGMGQVVGGVTGTAKSVIKGTVRGAVGGDVGDKISDELEHRSDYVGQMLPGDLGKSKLIRDAVDRQLQGWTLGLWGDLLSSSLGGRGGLLEFAAGPIVGGSLELATTAAQGNGKQLGREALRMMPVPGPVGSGIQSELLPTRAQENRSSGVSSSRGRSNRTRSR